ncbi:hypothetical protein ACO0K9_11045 [Undibacterium sp. Ji50W]|uniref:hypothetical protein n=1 Tax=Undibacterium sp. Ji50W TaxID=3413041 RepID=UPI003BF3BE39
MAAFLQEAGLPLPGSHQFYRIAAIWQTRSAYGCIQSGKLNTDAKVSQRCANDVAYLCIIMLDRMAYVDGRLFYPLL